MKECLYCKKAFEEKKNTAKFCSTSCRVMNNRKNGKKNEIKPYQVKVLYDAMIDMISSVKLPDIYNSKKIDNITHNELKQSVEPKDNPIKITPAHWVELRRGCETADDYAKWLDDLENDQFLTTREKSQIKQTV